MIHWSDKLQLTSNDATFNGCEISSMVSVLRQKGIGVDSALAPSNVHAHSLGDPSFRVSLKQQCQIQEHWRALCGDSTQLPRLAERLHLTSYGIAGYALLSSEHIEEAIGFAELYSPLLNLKFSLSLQVDGPYVALQFVERYAMDHAARETCSVLELAKIGVLLKDVLGEAFQPIDARCVGADDAQVTELQRILRCTVIPGGVGNQIRFHAVLLHKKLPQSNAATHAACVRVCDDLMEGLASRFDLERHIKGIMLKATERPPTLMEIADQLCVSARTLRRRLDALQTSYNQILADVRKELAIRYLTTTESTTEDIAQYLGYSEAANFRHAFKRWTGQTPRDYRAAQSPQVGLVQMSRRQVSSRMSHPGQARGLFAECHAWGL